MAIREFLSADEIGKRLDVVADQINKDYKDTDGLVIVCILRGSFIFCADLVRRLNVPVRMEFMSVSSYGDSTTTSGEVRIHLDLKEEIANKDVLVVEDIVDTGTTMKTLIQTLSVRKPKSLKLASLLYKPARAIHKVPIDYLAFEIEDHFVIGYGLDFAGKYRELPYIGIYESEGNE